MGGQVEKKKRMVGARKAFPKLRQRLGGLSVVARAMPSLAASVSSFSR